MILNAYCKKPDAEYLKWIYDDTNNLSDAQGKSYNAQPAILPVNGMWYSPVSERSSCLVVYHVAHQPWEIRFSDPLGQNLETEVEIVVSKDSAMSVEFVEDWDHLLAFGDGRHCREKQKITT